MTHTHRRLAVALAILVFASLAASADPILRPLEAPTPTGLKVTINDVVWEGTVLASLRLDVTNESTNVLLIDLARSSIAPAGAEVRPLAVFVGPEFVTTLMPTQVASGQIDLLQGFEIGAQLRLYLRWTLGAVVESASWIWEIAESTSVSSEPAPAATVTSAPPLAPAEPAETAAQPATQPADDSQANFFIGLAALVVVAAALGLLAWWLWG